MFTLDKQFLIDLGLGALDAETSNRMLAHIYESLEMRVGMHIAGHMTDQQLDEFGVFVDSEDDAGALAWLNVNFPSYRDTVAHELELLKAEIWANSRHIIAAEGIAGSEDESRAG